MPDFKKQNIQQKKAGSSTKVTEDIKEIKVNRPDPSSKSSSDDAIPSSGITYSDSPIQSPSSPSTSPSPQPTTQPEQASNTSTSNEQPDYTQPQPTAPQPNTPSPENNNQDPTPPNKQSPKPKKENVESKGKDQPKSDNKNKPKDKTPSDKGKTGTPSKLDKAKQLKDPKQAAKNQAKDYAKKAVKKAATKAATKALGATLGSAFGGPIGTALGYLAGELAGMGIDVAEKLIKYMLYVIAIILVMFAALIFLIFMAIGSFFFSGGGGTSAKQQNSISRQVTPINTPTNIPTGAKSLDKPRNWYKSQAISTGCHCTSVAMYLSFLGYETSENDICYIQGEDYLKDSVSFGDVESKYPVTRAGQVLDTNSFSKLKQFIIDNIDEGKPVIIGVGQPIAYGKSHFLVVVGYDKNYIYVNDPNASNPSSQTWATLQSAKYYTAPDYHAYTMSLT